VKLPRHLRAISDASAFARKAWRRIEYTVRWERRLHQWEERRLDRRLGIDTAGSVEPADLMVPEGDATAGFAYVGTQPRLARLWLAALPGRRDSFTFVDMGSGKGRVLAIAAEAGFARVVGVEFAKELHEVAAANARLLRKRRLSIEPILGDAGAFEFPEEPIVVYFSNPFRESVMEHVVDNLSASYAALPRPIVVVYEQMTEERPNRRTRNIELLDRVPFLADRTLPHRRGPIDRRVLRLFTVRVYESPEARAADALTTAPFRQRSSSSSLRSASRRFNWARRV
jgi:SAM-dependent methyltransferase